MSISMTKADGITVFTVTSDPGSNWPVLCQVLQTLCCSPVCAVSKGKRMVMPHVQSALATTQVMTGLFTIGLGAILLSSYGGPYFMWGNPRPYWLGAVFIVSGIFSILADRYPSPCLVTLTVGVNLITATLAITAIVFYLVDEGARFGRGCQPYESSDYNYYGNRERHRVNLTDVEAMEKRHRQRGNLNTCLLYQYLLQPVAIGVRVLLVVFAVLQLCVTISVAALDITALKKSLKKKQVSEVQQPLMEEVAANPVA